MGHKLFLVPRTDYAPFTHRLRTAKKACVLPSNTCPIDPKLVPRVPCVWWSCFEVKQRNLVVYGGFLELGAGYSVFQGALE